MKRKEHTRNQKRMYRIHKQEDRIHDLELMIGKLQQENQKLNGAIQTYKILLKANVEENKQLKDNWNKLKELIDIKLYNTEYLQKLCGYKIDEETHMILDIIKKEMQELERGNKDE